MRKLSIYLAILVVLTLAAGPLQAGDSDILDLKPPQGEAGKPQGEPDLHEGKFDGYGVIDMITANEIVIDDATYRLAGAVVFKYLNGSSTSSDQFPVGTKVWFVLLTDNTIKSVWKEGG